MTSLDSVREALIVVSEHPEVFTSTASSLAEDLMGKDNCPTPKLRNLEEGLRFRQGVLTAFQRPARVLNTSVGLNQEGAYALEQISLVLGVISSVLPPMPKPLPFLSLRA